MKNSPIHLGVITLKSSIKEILNLETAISVNLDQIAEIKKDSKHVRKNAKGDLLSVSMQNSQLIINKYDIKSKRDDIRKCNNELDHAYATLRRKINSYKPLLLLLYPDYELDQLFEELEAFTYDRESYSIDQLVQDLDSIKDKAEQESDETLAQRYKQHI